MTVTMQVDVSLVVSSPFIQRVMAEDNALSINLDAVQILDRLKPADLPVMIAANETNDSFESATILFYLFTLVAPTEVAQVVDDIPWFYPVVPTLDH